MKLELKHLASYLPYKLMLYMEGFPYVEMKRLDVDKNVIFKPILRPLSDLTKEIEHNGEKFVSIKEIIKCNHLFDFKDGYWTKDGHTISGWTNDCSPLPYWIVEKLFEWHFDCFDLLSKDLAVNYNDISK